MGDRSEDRQDLFVVLFRDFTALDVFGPVEALSKTGKYRIRYISITGGMVENDQGIRMETEAFPAFREGAVLLIPGGFGTRPLVKDPGFLAKLAEMAEASAFVLTVCTGSALAAAAHVLDGRAATSNVRSFAWARSCGPKVSWIPDVRWTRDGKYYTSAGVSAGIDMTLGFIRDRFGDETVKEVCSRMEYSRNEKENVFIKDTEH